MTPSAFEANQPNPCFCSMSPESWTHERRSRLVSMPDDELKHVNLTKVNVSSNVSHFVDNFISNSKHKVSTKDMDREHDTLAPTPKSTKPPMALEHLTFGCKWIDIDIQWYSLTTIGPLAWVPFLHKKTLRCPWCLPHILHSAQTIHRHLAAQKRSTLSEIPWHLKIES